MLSLICLMLLSHSIFATSTFIPSCDDDNNDFASQPKSIFILAGQSNMAGRGGLISNIFNKLVIPPEAQSNPKILRLNPELSWEEAEEPLHEGIDTKQCGMGPGMVFANLVLEQDPSIGVIGLVPCAVGGTNLTNWTVGGDLYNNMLKRGRAALQAGGGQLRGILWYQGESDTANKTAAETYKSTWETIFTQLRLDLESPSLPVIQVIIEKPVKGGLYLKEVRAAQKAINLPNVKSVDSCELEVGGDQVHLSPNGQLGLGRKLADAFLQFEAQAPSSA